MNVPKFLATFVLIALVSGCAALEQKEDRVVEKIARLVKIQHPCPSPGTPTSVECHYRLTITSVTENRVKGKIPSDAIEPSKKGCETSKAHGDIPKDYICPDPKDHPDNEYAFQVDPSTPVQQGQTYNFVNVLRSKDLKVMQ